MTINEYREDLAGYEAIIDETASDARGREILERVFSRDHTLWKNDPREVADRLGWLDCPRALSDMKDEILSFVDSVRAEGFTHALLLGMGGSSLAPELFSRTFGTADGFLHLDVLDMTDPDTILAKKAAAERNKTLFIVSSKSGGTVETLSFMKYFFYRCVESLGRSKAGSRFIAITDPGSGLEKTAAEMGFRKIFRADPEIGGRYSALSHFGMVPAALIGMDMEKLAERALAAENACRENGGNAVRLGLVMGELAQIGLDKLTIITSPQIASFGAWAEQLIAESTGKQGVGILPVVGETIAPPDAYGKDRLFIYLRLANDTTYDDAVAVLAADGRPLIHIGLADTYDLCGEFYGWELATAVAGVSLGINPFDQPNVESAKKSAKRLLAEYTEKGRLPESPPSSASDGLHIYSEGAPGDLASAFDTLMTYMKPGKNDMAGRSYLAIQAYVPPSLETDRLLLEMRTAVRNRYRIAVTTGYGPRFLHSTGQLHKGDAGNGLFIQLISDAENDTGIPDKMGEGESSVTFGTLKKAQALGDRQALTEAGRKVLGIQFDADVVRHLNVIKNALQRS